MNRVVNIPVIYCQAEEPDHVAAEAADVLYFALTRCVAAGVGLREASSFVPSAAAAACGFRYKSLLALMIPLLSSVSYVRFAVLLTRDSAQIGEHLDYRSMKVKRRTGNAKSAEQRKKWGDVS